MAFKFRRNPHRAWVSGCHKNYPVCEKSFLVRNGQRMMLVDNTPASIMLTESHGET
jgi:hypothetical protein